ncbi:MAG: S8 family serine peptidase, partial [Elusimicrobiota bacterium]
LFGQPDQRGEHGTHVASTILAYAPKAKIINLKVLDEEKSAKNDIPEELQRDETMTLAYVVKGLQTVYEHNQAVASGKIKGSRIDVVNMSLGAGNNGATMNYDEMSSWVKKVSDQGVVVVVAAGNDGMDHICRPGIAPEALTVGAVDYFNRTAKFSSSKNVIQTKAGQTYDKPDIWAYGVEVDAARLELKGYAGLSPALLAKANSGTSMATPHVVGVTALLIQEARRNGIELTPAQVKKLFQNNSNPLDDGNPYLRSDSGVIDPVKAVEFLKKNIKLIKKLF